MLNLAGPAYDFGNVLYAVLQECEHKRRGLLPDRAEERLLEIAREKLGEVRESYVEAGGDPGYWKDLEREVLETAMPQYAAAAADQTRLEKSSYGVWRQGDPLARGLFGLTGLAVGGLIIAAPFIPLWEDAFALVLAAVGFLYPEVRRVAADYRHSRFLNRLIVNAEAYQKDQRLHYLSHARFDEALRSLGERETRVEKELGELGRGAEPTTQPEEREKKQKTPA